MKQDFALHDIRLGKYIAIRVCQYIAKIWPSDPVTLQCISYCKSSGALVVRASI